MIKIGIVPDLHFRQYLCGVDLLQSGFWPKLAAEIRDHLVDCDVIVWLGDMFHRWHPTPREVVEARRFVEVVNSSRMSFIVAGNHDYGRDRNNASELFSDFAEVLVNPAVELVDGVAFAFLPYPNKIGGVWIEASSRLDANFQTSAGLSLVVEDLLQQALEHGCPTGLFSHVTWANSIYSPGQPVPLTDVAVSSDTFGRWTQVFGGHIHLPQHLHSSGEPSAVDARYVGAVTAQNFGDDFLGRVCSWDVAINEVSEYQLQSSARFVTLETEEQFRTFEPSETSTTLVRWRREVSDVSELYRLQDLWKSKGYPGKLEITVARAEDDAPRRFEAAESTSLPDVFAAYVASRPDEIPELMRQPVLKVIEEVLQ